MSQVNGISALLKATDVRYIMFINRCKLNLLYLFMIIFNNVVKTVFTKETW